MQSGFRRIARGSLPVLLLGLYLALTGCLLTALQPSYASYYPGGSGPDPDPDPPGPSLTPPPPPPPPTFVTPPPVTSAPPSVLSLPPFHLFVPAVPVSRDVTGNIDLPAGIGAAAPGGGDILCGLSVLPDADFPQEKDLRGSSDWIIIRALPDTVYERSTPYSARLKEGYLLVSVRRPSRLALIETPEAEISLSAEGDVMLQFDRGLLRVLNITGRGTVLKVKLSSRLFGNVLKSRVLSLKPGFELLASQAQIGRSQLRPPDGIARRRFKVLAQGRVALSEFSLASVLESSALVAEMSQKDADNKARRIVSEMSKMAAVLNYLNGSGYTNENTGLAQGAGQSSQRPE